jgi:hypothetical protein
MDERTFEAAGGVKIFTRTWRRGPVGRERVMADITRWLTTHSRQT